MQHPLHWAVCQCPAARPQTLTSSWFCSLDKHPLFTCPAELSSQSMIVDRIYSGGGGGTEGQLPARVDNLHALRRKCDLVSL